MFSSVIRTTISRSVAKTPQLNSALKLTLYRSMAIKSGDKLPSALLTMENPGNQLDIKDFCKDKKTILVGVVGAFTPTCDNQVPPFAEHMKDFEKKGVQVAVITVNDPFVCHHWSQQLKLGDKLKVLADYKANFASATGMANAGIADLLGTTRSNRFMMLINNDTVEKIAVEANPGEVTCTDVKTALSWV